MRGELMRKQYTYKYPRPMVTVDVVVVTEEAKPRVLLIRRKHDPFAGRWAIPGGYVDMNEPLEEAAKRELLEETGIQLKRLEQIGAFGNPGRDPRGRTISVVYLARVNPNQLKPKADDDAAEVGWHSLLRPPPLAFDHQAILGCARRRLKEMTR